MCFDRWTPPPLNKRIQDCTDAERKISRPCWNLAAVQKAVASGWMSVQLTRSAQASVVEDLAWSSSDICRFIASLHQARYNDSEWCLPGGTLNHQPMKADSYLMGFNRFKGAEHPAHEPWIYFKFTIRASTPALLVFSLHRSIY